MGDLERFQNWSFAKSQISVGVGRRGFGLKAHTNCVLKFVVLRVLFEPKPAAHQTDYEEA